MLVFDPPEETTQPLAEILRKLDIDGTVIIPESATLSDEQFRQLEEGTIRKMQRSTVGTLNPIVGSNFETRSDGEKNVTGLVIDIEDLWRVMYEHKRYVEAEGFSDTELDVLRIIEQKEYERVKRETILNSLPYECSDGTLHNALDGLIEKGLISKRQRGLYSYEGP